VLVVLAVGVVAGLLPRLHKRAQVVAETRELSVPTVTIVSPVAAKAPPPLVLSGELKPLIDAPIYARATGYVRRWVVDLGAHVEAGQLMAELEIPEIDSQLTANKAAVRQAQAAETLAEATARRWTQMLTAKTVSAQEAQEKTSDFDLKKAATETAVANVERLQQMVGFATIVAPFPGTVTARNLDVGQLVNAGSGQELFRVARTDKLRLFVRVPQSYSRAVAEGQGAELTVPEIRGRVFRAKVVRTAGAMDAASRTLLTELEVDNAKGELLAGSYAEVRLTESHPEAALTVPSNCLLFRAEGPQLGVVDASNHVELRTVTLGRDFGQLLEILKGITASDRVIVNPPDALVNGIQVRLAGDVTAPAEGGTGD
jgi:RND family efflux transporter MFP subunit